MKSAQAGQFDAQSFAELLWSGPVAAAADSAISLGRLIDETTLAGPAALDRYAHALAIGNHQYAMICAKGMVKAHDEAEIILTVPHADSSIDIRVALEYVYGNAIRDASAAVEVKDFPNSSDLSAIAEALNRIVRSRVVAAFKKDNPVGQRLEVTGAVELHRAHIRWQGLEIHPVRITRK
jgi:predicted lipoprotein